MSEDEIREIVRCEIARFPGVGAMSSVLAEEGALSLECRVCRVV